MLVFDHIQRVPSQHKWRFHPPEVAFTGSPFTPYIRTEQHTSVTRKNINNSMICRSAPIPTSLFLYDDEAELNTAKQDLFKDIEDILVKED